MIDDSGEAFTGLARLALAAYPFRRPALEFLSHSENLTFQVTDGQTGAHYLLRMHWPVSGAFRGPRQKPKIIEAELIWLEALARDTQILVPQPVRNRTGEWVTHLQRPGGAALPCTVLTWLDGVPFRVDAPEAPQMAAQLGDLLAGLHSQARAWQPPAGFKRPEYGAEFFQQVSAALQIGVDLRVFAADDYATIQAAIQHAADLMAGQQSDPPHWGLIHNDLQPSNLLLCQDKLCPIDFSLCGFGFYLSDLATSLGSLPVALRRPVWDSYSAHCPPPPEALRQVEGCLIVSRMNYYNFVLSDPSQQEWLRGRIPEVIETMCIPFLDEQGFLFEVR